MPTTPPSRADWSWVGARTVHDLCHYGTDPKESQWIRRVYNWFYRRVEPSVRATLPPPISDEQEGPPENLFPVLAVDSRGSGRLGFARLTFGHARPPVPGEDVLSAAQGAASAVADWFRQLNHNTEWPRVELLIECEPSGTSAGLSAMLLVLGSMLGVAWPADVCATGIWCAGHLEPVEPQTLPAKIDLARTWGYRRLLVVEGQREIPSEPPIEIICVPPDPEMAILIILSKVCPDAGENAITAALSAFDIAAVRGEPEDRNLNKVLAATGPFIGDAAPVLARHVAHDIRSRALLHAGLTSEAEDERKQATVCSPKLKPDGWIGDYLRWHQPAHHSVLALDFGFWDDDIPEHREVDACIEELENQRLAGRAGCREILAEMYLRNTRGRRYEFLGRWYRDHERLRKAWEDRVSLRDYWDELVAYCDRLGLRDGDLHRQHNQCMDVLASFWEWEGRLPDEWPDADTRFWPDAEVHDVLELNSFDIAALLRWRRIRKQDTCIEFVSCALHTASSRGAGYPNFLVFEAVLRYHLGDDNCRREAAKGLAGSALFEPDLPPHSILTLLAIRSEQVLAETKVRSHPPVRPATGTHLRGLAENLMSDSRTIIARCPY